MLSRRQLIARGIALGGAAAALASRAGGQAAVKPDWDLLVAGGGSAGFGAALAAGRRGLKVLLVEKADCLGGTSTRGGVNGWEPVAGATGIPFDLYRALKKTPLACGIYSFGRHMAWFDPRKEKVPFPGGEMVIDPQYRYADTLQRHGSVGLSNQAWCRQHLHGVAFEPDAMAQTMKKMLEATANTRVELNTAFVRASVRDGQIDSVELTGGRQVAARCYVDATGDGWLCESAGCDMLVGQEAAATFNEPHAPSQATNRVNGATLLYRAARRQEACIDPLEEGVPAKCWWRGGFPPAHMIHYPNGDWNVNMLPTMEGRELVELGYAKAYAECRRRVLAHWHHLQNTCEEFRQFRLSWIAPALGIRESRRVRGLYMLNENDLVAGLAGQKHDDIVCLCDHPMDTHGSHGRGLAHVRTPYGVPYRCLLAKGVSNLLMAGRAAGFSSLAASSCRLSRTMMQLGQAAGTAAALACRAGLAPPAVTPGALRDALAADHVQLQHPLSETLRDHVRAE